MRNKQFPQYTELRILSNKAVLANLAVLILAAGFSRRLGQPKQLLLKNGKSLVLHTAELALELKPQSTIAVINNNIDIKNALKDIPIQLVLNSQANTGMASSLQIAARFFKNHHGPLLILGIDQPLLDAAYLQQLVQYSIQKPDMNIVSHYAQTMGIPAIVQPELLQQSEILSGDTGLKKLLMQQPEKLITLPAPQLGFDIDTPDDLLYAREQDWID